MVDEGDRANIFQPHFLRQRHARRRIGLTPTTRTSACSAANLSNLRCPGCTTLKLPETNAMVWSGPHEARIAWQIWSI